MVHYVTLTVSDHEIHVAEEFGYSDPSDIKLRDFNAYVNILQKADKLLCWKADRYIVDHPELIVVHRAFRHKRPQRSHGGFKNVMVLYTRERPIAETEESANTEIDNLTGQDG